MVVADYNRGGKNGKKFNKVMIKKYEKVIDFQKKC
jgi:hypothetical protein